MNIPPAVPKDLVPTDSKGMKFTITAAATKKDVQTSNGKIQNAFTIEGKLGEDTNNIYSYLFDIGKDQVTGSVGRILSKFGFKDTGELTDKAVKEKMVGKDITVKRRGDKLSWY